MTDGDPRTDEELKAELLRLQSVSCSELARHQIWALLDNRRYQRQIEEDLKTIWHGIKDTGRTT